MTGRSKLSPKHFPAENCSDFIKFSGDSLKGT